MMLFVDISALCLVGLEWKMNTYSMYPMLGLECMQLFNVVMYTYNRYPIMRSHAVCLNEKMAQNKQTNRQTDRQTDRQNE